MDKIDELLTRGITNIIPSKEELEKLLRSNKKLNVYLGIDPTAPKIHLGHAVNLRKLQTLVDLGHTITFLIGDFTTLVGDNSDKESERPMLTESEIEANWQTYKAQAEKILDFSKVQLHHNSEWLAPLTFSEIIRLCQNFSLNDYISREIMKKKLEKGTSIRLDEVLYPIMQGYDSWFMDTDIQVGAADQTFNMQAGRVLQKKIRNKESFILVNAYLTGTDGRKMSKSWGNAIWLTDEPNDMYGKVMRINDDLIIEYFTLATDVSLSEIAHIQSRLTSGENPMNLKKELALAIVSQLHSPDHAKSAQEYFETAVQKGQTPTDMPTLGLSNLSDPNVLSALVACGFAKSNSEARRLIDQGAIKLNDQKISDYKQIVQKDQILSSGSHKHIKII